MIDPTRRSSDGGRVVLPARLPADRVRRTYTWIAPVHDVLALLVERRARASLLAAAAARNGDRLLEVAVGTGLSFHRLVAANPDGFNHALDLTPAMLRRAVSRLRRKGLTAFRIHLGDARALPFEDCSLDLVVNSYMLDMMPVSDFPDVLAEFFRVLRPGGRLALANMTTPRTRVQALWDGVYRLHPPLLGGCRGVRAAPFVMGAGFQDVDRQFVSQWSFPSEVICARRP